MLVRDGVSVDGPASFVDLGSGAGLPGLVLASIWKRSRVLLLDSNKRKALFLEGVVRECGWSGRVSVEGSRAETAGREPHFRAKFDLVVARGFGPPPVTAECGAPFLRCGGILVVSEPPAEDDHMATPPSSRSARGLEEGSSPQAVADVQRWPSAPLRLVGLEPISAWRGRFGYQVLRQVELCPDRLPRRVGIPAKRPLYSVGVC